MSITKGSKIVKAFGFLALVGVIIAIGTLIFKGIRNAKKEGMSDDTHAEEETNGV